jgi:hypothetical protein
MSLATKDINKIISFCTWSKAKIIPPSIRLFDQSILIMDHQVKVSYKEETETRVVSGHTPFKIESKDVITIECSGLKIRYPGTKDTTSTKITNSSLTNEHLEILQYKIATQQYWSILRIPSLVDYILISIQILFLIGLVLIFKQMAVAKRQLHHLRRFRNFARVTLLRRPRHPISGPTIQG